MGAGTLTIYSASAGSGKTHQLAGIYLEKLFRSRLNYRKILAVTFTHKATAEMKERILSELYKLREGEESVYMKDLISSTGKSEEQIRKEAEEILFSILHDYSRFSVTTIDSFYQKIIRAFARDIGLHSGFNIEIDHSKVLGSAVDNMIDSATTDTTIRNWLIRYARANIEEGKNWDLKKNIVKLSSELFNEKFKLLPSEEKKKLQDKEFLNSFIDELRGISSSFKKTLKEKGLLALSFFKDHHLGDEMFYYKGKGVPLFIRSIADGDVKEPNSYVRAIFADPPKWSSGVASGALIEALGRGFDEAVKDAVRYFDNNIVACRTSEVILSNIYILGILSDVLYHVHLITNDENMFLLSDAGEMIYLITENDQAPFIYEKIGNTFENFMIDEFQDTSVIQWKNFRHLIDNSMAMGFDNLVVGDIKQSIYRWRNSDWKTLSDLRHLADNKRYKTYPLNTNWRSCSNIIRFNNALFSVIPYQIDKELSEMGSTADFRELYNEANQVDPGKKPEGYVRIEFVEGSEASWTESVLAKLPNVIESLEDNGYRASDIGIIVRNNSEGAIVLKEIINYSNSCPEENKIKYNYNIISGESLLLSNSPDVEFLIAALRVLENPEDFINRAVMLRFFLLCEGKKDIENIPLGSEELMQLSSGFFPPGYSEFMNSIRYLPLWNITEGLIGFFGLGRNSYNVAYLNSFQDLVINYMVSGNPGINAFIEWWESEGIKKSILLPQEQDSINVLTIHKSKGLEFGVVILPFISWNLDHKSFHQTILWTTPGVSPYNKLGIIPVRYKKELENTIFREQYLNEKHSAYLDNINLLYVAFTRAKNAIIGFAPDNPSSNNRIASVVKNALTSEETIPKLENNFLKQYFDRSANVFEYGTLPGTKAKEAASRGYVIEKYPVSENTGSLKLKLHWENYVNTGKNSIRESINYGKIMHEIFSEIVTSDDVSRVLKKKVIEGKINVSEELLLSGKIKDLINNPETIRWFARGNEVLNEVSILLPDSTTRRPDRIVIRDGRATVIDFKFGEENSSYLNQVRQYSKLLIAMGYDVAETCLWYVDSGKIISA